MMTANLVKLKQEHNHARVAVQDQVRAFHRQSKHFRVYHGCTSSTRPIKFNKSAVVDISGMNRLFPVDTTSLTVRVEPNVTMDKLVEHTLCHGLVPQVVMELKGITVGGGYSGMSGESSMHKYGLFQNTISEIEIVLGDGTCMRASMTQKQDLLREAGGSLGTFGVVTLLAVKLAPAKSHVQINVKHVQEGLDIPKILEENAKNSTYDFIEGFYLPDRSGIIMLSRMVDFADRPSSGVTLHPRDLCWFAEYVEAHGRKHAGVAPPLLLKLEEYLFRYDQGAFWGGRLAFQHLRVPRNRITEALARPFLNSRMCFHALHRTNLASEYVIQDFGLPATAARDFISYVHNILPDCQLFLSVMKPASKEGIDVRFTERFRRHSDQWVIGVGVYGRGPQQKQDFLKLNKDLERQVYSHHGIKLLYARTYYEEHEFWEVYDKPRYTEMRERYHAGTLPTVYDKLEEDMGHDPPTRVTRGILKTVRARITGKTSYLF